METYISELDTWRFGFKVAKINKFSDSPSDVVTRLKQLDVKLVISRVSVNDIKAINEMEDAGFRLKDLQVTYNFDLTSKIPEQLQSNVNNCRLYEEGDEAGISLIAAESFIDYGHYARNEKTQAVDSSIIYADWARRTCESKEHADTIIVSESNGNIDGFLSLKIFRDNSSNYAAGVMGAVAGSSRGAGTFRAINIASLYWAKSEGLTRLENNVLVTNLAVNKTYTNLGFQIIRSEATFHCWLG